MIRTMILAGGTLALCATASAQQSLDFQVHRGQLRDAGTYHYVSKTWTRAGRAAQRPDGFAGALTQVYDNTCLWVGLAPNTLIWNSNDACEDIYDEGRIPASGPTGAMAENFIASFSFAHVTFANPPDVDLSFTFYDHLGGNCVGFTNPTPPEPPFAGQVVLNSANGVTLPGDPTAFNGTAWILTVDLSGGAEFCLQSDGDGTTGNMNDLFTVRYRHENPMALTGNMGGGPVIAGDPSVAGFGACTYQMTGSQACGTDPTLGPCGTGLGSLDTFWGNIDGDDPSMAGNQSTLCSVSQTTCFFFGGWPANAWSSYYLTLQSSGMCGSTVPPPVLYCTGKTTSTGCIPFLDTNGTASATSTAAFAIRSNDNITLESGLLIYSFSKANLNFHGGKLCVKAPFVRTGAKAAKTVACADPFATCTTGTCGLLNRNFNVTIQSGNDPLLTAGQAVTAQWRQRDPTDPAGFGDNLSNGVRFVILP